MIDSSTRKGEVRKFSVSNLKFNLKFSVSKNLRVINAEKLTSLTYLS